VQEGGVLSLMAKEGMCVRLSLGGREEGRLKEGLNEKNRDQLGGREKKGAFPNAGGSEPF